MSTFAPLPKPERHAVDYRDELEHEAVAQILGELPPEHPAVRAYAGGELAGASTVSIMRMVERPDLVERLKAAHWDGMSRIPNGISATAIRSTPRS